MGTLAILRGLLLYSNWPRHPLVSRETVLGPPGAGAAERLMRLYHRSMRAGLLIILIAVGLELFRLSSVSVFTSLLSVFMPLGGLTFVTVMLMLLLGWPIPLVVSGSMAILRERTGHTWELLLLTPLSHREILLSKLAVGLSRQQSLLTVTGLLQTLPLIVLLGAVSRYLTGVAVTGCTPAALLGLTALLFVVDRVQQLILFSLIGLAVGLLTDNWAVGMVGAAASGILAWLIHSALAFVLIYGLATERFFDPLQAIFVGLPALAFIPHGPLDGVLALAGALLLQEGCIRLLFHWLTGHCSR